MAHTWQLLKRPLRVYGSYITRMNESCHAYEWAMSHVWMSHATRMKALRASHTCLWVHAISLNVPCHAYAWVTSHILNELCHAYAWVTSHILKIHVTDMKALRASRTCLSDGTKCPCDTNTHRSVCIHCNTLKNTATHTNVYGYGSLGCIRLFESSFGSVPLHYQHTWMSMHILQHAATRCNTL